MVCGLGQQQRTGGRGQEWWLHEVGSLNTRGKAESFLTVFPPWKFRLGAEARPTDKRDALARRDERAFGLRRVSEAETTSRGELQQCIVRTDFWNERI